SHLALLVQQQIESDAKPSGALAQKFAQLRIRGVPSDRLGIPVVGHVEGAERNLYRVILTHWDAFGQAQVQREEIRKPRRVGDTGIDECKESRCGTPPPERPTTRGSTVEARGKGKKAWR